MRNWWNGSPPDGVHAQKAVQHTGRSKGGIFRDDGVVSKDDITNKLT